MYHVNKHVLNTFLQPQSRLSANNFILVHTRVYPHTASSSLYYNLFPNVYTNAHACIITLALVYM